MTWQVNYQTEEAT